MSKYKLKIITEKNTWNDFIIHSNFEFYSFVDSWQWWELQKLEWNTVLRYGIFEWKKIVWILQMIKIVAKRGTYFFTPHWPLFNTPNMYTEREYFSILKSILPKIKEVCKKENVSFLRYNCVQKNTIWNRNNYKKLWFINAPMHVHAEDTHLLNIKPSETELLWNMHKKDRYYINRAIKEWVTVRIDNKKDHIEKLIEMHQHHANRNNGKLNYSAFSENYIKNLYKIFDTKNISTISVSYNGKIESILMTIKFWKFCVYYIAASDIVVKSFLQIIFASGKL